ncbi:hypothetical protein AM493_10145 [Flavobacterium akiainvivens]|uniref:Uncharacterized protein n=1 Tax=Flavobacterium akiainvivens TaxID=1202724 RepID=A0A0M9VI78_9FLAO|nr:hypothetical protein [Flavobacterium akiainvivens]KOS06352.1 hypothetical protein AM493_10145 [Flavobacterium akiainvivens]
MKRLVTLSVFALISCGENTKLEVVRQNVTKPVAETPKPDTVYNEKPEHHGPEYDYIDTSKPFTIKEVKPNVKAGEPFSTLDYDGVVAFDYDGSYEKIAEANVSSDIIGRTGKLFPFVIARKALSQNQVDAIVTPFERQTDIFSFGCRVL